MKNISKIILVIAMVVGVFIAGTHLFHSAPALGDGTTIVKINVSTGVSVGNTSTKLLDASSGRVYAVIVNDGSVPIYLSLNGSPAVAGTGVRLNASGGSYEINSLNQVVAQINAITSSSTANVTVSASQ